MRKDRQPNIVFIYIDDMGWRDLSCQGSHFYETPNIDRIAREGVRFTDAYAACPVCSPSRASVMTGQYPARVGITNWIPGNPWGRLMGVPYFHALPREHVTVAQALKQGGYQTGHVGKWHLGADRGHWPGDFGFEWAMGGYGLGAPPTHFSPYRVATIPDGPVGEYLTDRLTDEAIGFVKRADRSRPFYLNLWHYTVHTPIQAPAGLVEKYKAKAARLGLDKVKALEEGEAFPCLHKKHLKVTRRLIQSDPTYAAMIESLDQNVGRLMGVLEELGIADDTLLIFTSDNGGLSTAEGSPTTNAPLCEGKGWMYDGGVRVPLLARWPKRIKPGSVVSQPVTSTDFYPTFLEAAGLPAMPGQHVDGVSMMPVLTGEAQELAREGIYWHYPHYSNQGGSPACAVRAGDWKLIEFFDPGKVELYNLKSDIEEEKDLSLERPEIVDTLWKKLKSWRESIEAKIPQVNVDYEAMLSGAKPCPNGNGIVPGDDRAGQGH
jgi:arylsulfatase A-like enzyme